MRGHATKGLSRADETVRWLVNMVYVVDDHADSAEYLARLLRKIGFKAVVFEACADVLVALDRAPPPSLVILDVMMPQMDGIACLREIRRRHKPDRLPVVMYSGDFTLHTVHEARAAGAHEFVVKGTTGWPEFREVIYRLAGERPTAAGQA